MPSRPPRQQRRQFIRSAMALGAFAWPPGPARAADAPGPVPLEGFAESPSVRAGSTLAFYFRDPAAAPGTSTATPLTITRLGWPDAVVHRATVNVRPRPLPAEVWLQGGLSWGAGYSIYVPSATPSGLYWATLGTGERACHMPFVLRPARRTPEAAVLVQVPVTTAQAYNPYGGKSLYEYNSSAGERALAVSMQRPFADAQNYAFDPWQPPLLRWLAKNGIVVDLCCSLDLHQDPQVLSGYQLFLSAGHDEYWSREMRQRLDAFVAAGGNAAIFSGNSCWWQVRFEPDGSGGAGLRMRCAKTLAQDSGGTAETKTVNWFDLATPWPENGSIGLSFRQGASWTSGLPRPVSPFVVQRPGHWSLAGTGLGQGARFGAPYVGYETDAAEFAVGRDGRPHPTGRDGTPPTLQIIAQADCSGWDAAAKALGLPGERPGYAALAVFSRGGGQGTVFNAGTTDWVYGLQPELDGQTPNAVSRITLNVLRKLSTRWSEPAEVRQWHAVPAPDHRWHCWYTLGTETPASQVLDGAVFRALAGPQAGAVPVYRWRAQAAANPANPATGNAPQRHGLSLALPAAGSGWTGTGIAFYAWAAAGPDTLPVYQWRSRDAQGQPLLGYSTQATPAAGWVLDGVAFHAPL